MGHAKRETPPSRLGWGADMLRLVSYSYPPDNSPASHRPYQLASYLSKTGVPFRLHVRQRPELSPKKQTAKPAPAVASGGTKRDLFAMVSKLLRPLLEIDKALFWGLLTLPALWWGLARDWLREWSRPDVWATAPGVTNLYVAGIAAILSGSRLHVDLRDAISGINGQRMPILTWLVLRYASTCSVVTDSLARFVRERAPYLQPEVIYNGISAQATSHAVEHDSRGEGWVRLSYAGAIYGGARPYESALGALRDAAELLGSGSPGIELTFVGREDVSTIIERFQSPRLRISALGEMGKDDALRLSAMSDVNMVLIGSAEGHRCAIPLKVFDLLGVGRPIFYFGPVDADGCLFLRNVASTRTFMIDSEAGGKVDLSALAAWLGEQVQTPTRPITTPAAATQSEKILTLISSGRVPKSKVDTA